MSSLECQSNFKNLAKHQPRSKYPWSELKFTTSINRLLPLWVVRVRLAGRFAATSGDVLVSLLLVVLGLRKSCCGRTWLVGCGKKAFQKRPAPATASPGAPAFTQLTGAHWPFVPQVVQYFALADVKTQTEFVVEFHPPSIHVRPDPRVSWGTVFDGRPLSQCNWLKFYGWS